MKLDTPFDFEQTAFQIKVLHELMYDVVGDTTAGEDTEKIINRLWVLLDVTEPLVDGLYQYFSGGASNDRT